MPLAISRWPLRRHYAYATFSPFHWCHWRHYHFSLLSLILHAISHSCFIRWCRHAIFAIFMPCRFIAIISAPRCRHYATAMLSMRHRNAQGTGVTREGDRQTMQVTASAVMRDFQEMGNKMVTTNQNTQIHQEKTSAPHYVLCNNMWCSRPMHLQMPRGEDTWWGYSVVSLPQETSPDRLPSMHWQWRLTV